MADENKIDQDPDNLENLSPEELQEHIQEEKKNAKRSLRFAFTALIAIIAVCIAWFAANNQVTMTGTQISAENDQPFEIASVGEKRQDGEKNYLKDENNNNILSDGSTKHYNEYIDIETGNSTPNGSTYHVGSSGIAWYMPGQESLVPGAGGKLEFYIIPKKTGLKSVTIKLTMEGYSLDEAGKKVEKITNKKIQNLLNGHILLFRHLDDKYGYYDWLGENRELKIKAPQRGDNDNTFVSDIPYKVTLYWKWPQYFRNYIYTQRSTYGDLFTDEMVKDHEADYESIIKFVQDQSNVASEDTKLFYATNKTGTENSSQASISGTIDKNMDDETLDACSTYYNQADEYIGKNTQYVYIQVEVN